LVCVGVAAVIVWHKSDDGMALLIALTLLLLGVVSTPPVSALVAIQPLWVWPARVMRVLFFECFYLSLYLFPNGRFIPPWTRWLAGIWGVYPLAGLLFPVLIPPIDLLTAATRADILVNIWLLGSLGIAISAQIYRYHRASTPLQRQQTKWIVFGFLAVFLTDVGVALLILSFPWLRQPGVTNIIYKLVGVTALLCVFLVLATTIGLAILRHRLWDIDVLINRTLVYGMLTTALALIYIGCVVLLQTLVNIFTNQSRSEVVTVVSTLAIVALFSPLRKRIQNVIDKRFYRHKYNAAKVLAAFGTTVRDETDLDALKAELLNAVDATMQPERVTLWLHRTRTRSKVDGIEHSSPLI